MDDIKYKLIKNELQLKEASLNYDTCLANIIQYHLSSKREDFTDVEIEGYLSKCDVHKDKVNKLLDQHKELSSMISEIN